MISWLKAKAIALADRINAAHDVFEDFTRPAMPKYPEKLVTKQARFEADLLGNFLRGGTIVNYRIPLPLGSPLDLGDQALFHGIYTAMFAFKYAVAPDVATADLFYRLFIGLAEHQPKGVLIRGVSENGDKWQLDASNDQATGHLAGLYFGWRYGPENLKPVVAKLMDEWAMNILSHDGALVNPDGKPTTFGQLDQGWRTDPLRITLYMAILAAASKMTGSMVYRARLEDLMDSYGTLIPFAKAKLLWWDTVYDTHRAALHLTILEEITHDSRCSMGLMRIFELAQKSGNAWVLFLCTRNGVVGMTAKYVQVCKAMLSEYTLEDKQYNSARMNSDHADHLPLRTTVWNNEWVSVQPLPRWMVTGEDFVWQRSLYTIDRADPADSRYNMGDWLCAYWLGRLNGTITIGE